MWTEGTTCSSREISSLCREMQRLGHCRILLSDIILKKRWSQVQRSAEIHHGSCFYGLAQKLGAPQYFDGCGVYSHYPCSCWKMMDGVWGLLPGVIVMDMAVKELQRSKPQMEGSIELAALVDRESYCWRVTSLLFLPCIHLALSCPKITMNNNSSRQGQIISDLLSSTQDVLNPIQGIRSATVCKSRRHRFLLLVVHRISFGTSSD